MVYAKTTAPLFSFSKDLVTTGGILQYYHIMSFSYYFESKLKLVNITNTDLFKDSFKTLCTVYKHLMFLKVIYDTNFIFPIYYFFFILQSYTLQKTSATHRVL